MAALKSTLATIARRSRLALRLRRLCGIGSQQTVLERRPVEPADDGVHFFGVRRFDERETFGLLCFRIADNLDCIGNQIFGCQPAFDIVRGNPSGQIAQKDRKTHSAVVFDSIGGGRWLEDGTPSGTSSVSHNPKAVNIFVDFRGARRNGQHRKNRLFPSGYRVRARFRAQKKFACDQPDFAQY